MAPSLFTVPSFISPHLFPESQTDAIFLPHPKLPISFDLLPEGQPVCTQYSGSKQRCRVIPNVVTKEKILNLKG